MAKKTDEVPTPEDLGLTTETIDGGTADAATEREETATPPSGNTSAESGAGIPPAGPAPRKRGRPAGTSKIGGGDAPKKSASRKSTDTAALAKQIQGLHALAAMATGLGELAIHDQEAVMLANGITAVAEEYGLSIGGKTGAALQLFGAAAIVYLPRVMVIKAKAEAAEKARRANESNTIDGAGLVHTASH